MSVSTTLMKDGVHAWGLYEGMTTVCLGFLSDGVFAVSP